MYRYGVGARRVARWHYIPIDKQEDSKTWRLKVGAETNEQMTYEHHVESKMTRADGDVQVG